MAFQIAEEDVLAWRQADDELCSVANVEFAQLVDPAKLRGIPPGAAEESGRDAVAIWSLILGTKGGSVEAFSERPVYQGSGCLFVCRPRGELVERLSLGGIEGPDEQPGPNVRQRRSRGH